MPVPEVHPAAAPEAPTTCCSCGGDSTTMVSAWRMNRVFLQGAPRPDAHGGRHEELLAQTLWEMENTDETRTLDPRGLSFPQRIDAAINEASDFLESVLDVRFNGHDIEIDYQLYGAREQRQDIAQILSRIDTRDSAASENRIRDRRALAAGVGAGK